MPLAFGNFAYAVLHVNTVIATCAVYRPEVGGENQHIAFCRGLTQWPLLRAQFLFYQYKFATRMASPAHSKT